MATRIGEEKKSLAERPNQEKSFKALNQDVKNNNTNERLDSPDSANGSTSVVFDSLCDVDHFSKMDSYNNNNIGSQKSTKTKMDQVDSVDHYNCNVGEEEEEYKIQFQTKSITTKQQDDNNESRQAARLLHETRELLKLKDFSEEVRGALDVEQCVSQSELLLDMRESSIEGIIGAILAQVIKNEPSKRKEQQDAIGEIAREIFVPGSTHLMAQTIRGASDESWLCALCKSAQVQQRHMAVARFKSPVNMGTNAHQVKLFALIITPIEIKSTKGALETGRTFATMLADASFRRKLMAARSDNEFKSLMVLEAQQLKGALIEAAAAGKRLNQFDQLGANNSEIKFKGNAQHQVIFKNRLKYKFDPILSMSLAELSSTQISRLNSSSSSSSNITSFDLNNQDLNSPTFGKKATTTKLFESIISADSNFDLEAKQSPTIKFDEQHQEPAGKNESCCSCLSLCKHLEFGKGFWQDLSRRLKYYLSDYRDAFVGPPRTVQKTVATIWFLYFGILLPTIAFSSLNTHQTHGHMGDLRKAIVGQAIGGLAFALLGGQPLVIIMTTAPLCLYTKVVHQMCIDYGFHFPSMYAAVGFWNGVFLAIYSLFGFSKLMRWCTRSTEEIFALFIVIAFITDASKDLSKNFHKYYHSPACDLKSGGSFVSNSTLPIDETVEICRRETSLLFVLLMLGTLWLSTTLYKFNKTPYLSPGKRQLLADYALPTAVILMSFLGSFTFSEIYVESFPPLQELQFERAPMEQLPLTGLLVSMGLGFTLSLLFFMDQNISAAMVGAPQNNLKKGDAYHYDLLVVGVLNGFLSAFGLPMMHGVLPHSPLHVLSLSDLEEKLEEGHLRQVVTNCRETRVTSIVAHLLLLASLTLIPHPIAYIPRAVLNGLFLYMAVSSLDGLQIFERILLLVTEQNKYPPNHYIRRCPQRAIHKFTAIQLIQLLVMCLFGFSPINVIEMFFPVIILLMIPFRHKIVPKYVNEKYLEALDGKH